jgi:cobalt/nickel transport protein
MKKIILLSTVIVIMAAFFASANPDGLEKVAERLGFVDRGVERASIMTDYAVPGVKNERVSTSFAGIAGIFITLGIFWLSAKALKAAKG